MDGAHGRETFRAWLRWYTSAFANREWAVHDPISEEDRIVARYSGWATYRGGLIDIPPDDQRILETSILIFRVEDGLAREIWSEMSDLQVVMQLGALPPQSEDRTLREAPLSVARLAFPAKDGGRGRERDGADHQGARRGERRQEEERRGAEGGEDRYEEAGRRYREADEPGGSADEREAGQPERAAHEEGQTTRQPGDREDVQDGDVGREGWGGAEGDHVRQGVQVLAELGEPLFSLAPIAGDGTVQKVQDRSRQDEGRRIYKVARRGE